MKLNKNKNIKRNGKSYDLKDEIIGDILILEKVGNKNGNILWKCKCLLCNNVFELITASLTRENYQKSCGCSRKFVNNRNKNFKGYKEIHLSFFNKIRAGAKERNLEFNVTIEQIWDLFIKQNRQCALSGLVLYFGKSNRENTTASLDRINSSKGYLLDNIQWLHKSVNFMKQNYDDSYFVDICNRVSEYQKQKRQK